MQYWRPFTSPVLVHHYHYPHTPRHTYPQTLMGVCTSYTTYRLFHRHFYKVHNCWQLCGAISQVWIFRNPFFLVTDYESDVDGGDIGAGASVAPSICCTLIGQYNHIAVTTLVCTICSQSPFRVQVFQHLFFNSCHIPGPC